MIAESRNKNKTIFLGKKYPDRNLTSNGQKWFFLPKNAKMDFLAKSILIMLQKSSVAENVFGKFLWCHDLSSIDYVTNY